jgi:hypothetical protein
LNSILARICPFNKNNLSNTIKKRKDEKQTGIWIDKSNHCTLQDGKEAVSEIQSDLEKRDHDQEGDKGSFSGGQHMDSQSPLTKEKTSNQHLFYIYRYFTDSDELYILALRLKQS